MSIKDDNLRLSAKDDVSLSFRTMTKNGDFHNNKNDSFEKIAKGCDLLLCEIHVFPEWTFQKHEKMCREPSAILSN